MKSMILFSALVALLTFQTVAGHTVFTTFFVNDVNQGDGTCVRMPMTPNNATDPVIDLSSSDMACGYDGTQGVPLVCPVPQSAKLSFLYREWADGSRSGAIDISHKGPCAVYMKSVTSAINDTATGDGWFKIWDEGYDASTQKWCTDKLIENQGFLSVNIPSDLGGGYYLTRVEVLALHEADKTPPNPQFYTGCAQIFLESNQTTLPANTVKIPGYTNITDPAVLFNIYQPNFPYTPPGPAAYISGSSPIIQKSNILPTQTEGVLPTNAIIKNANWYSTELPTYNTSSGCEDITDLCFQKVQVCYDTAPPTGDTGCRIWEARCTEMQAACYNIPVNGPPDAGMDLNPALPSYSIPAAMNGEVSTGTNDESVSAIGTKTSAVVAGSTTSMVISGFLAARPNTAKAPEMITSYITITDTISTYAKPIYPRCEIGKSCANVTVIVGTVLTDTVDVLVTATVYPEPGTTATATPSVLLTSTLPLVYDTIPIPTGSPMPLVFSSGLEGASLTTLTTPVTTSVSEGSDYSSASMVQGPAATISTSTVPDDYSSTAGTQAPSISPSTSIAPDYASSSATTAAMSTATSPVPNDYSSSTSAAPTSTPTGLHISTNLRCGSDVEESCMFVPYGPCCSKWGYCGNSADHCLDGCQDGFGFCGEMWVGNAPGKRRMRMRRVGS